LLPGHQWKRRGKKKKEGSTERGRESEEESFLIRKNGKECRSQMRLGNHRTIGKNGAKQNPRIARTFCHKNGIFEPKGRPEKRGIEGKKKARAYALEAFGGKGLDQ